MPEFTNKEIIRMHLEEFLYETDQRGNLSMWGLMGYCIGYYGSIDADILDVVHDMVCEGVVLK